MKNNILTREQLEIGFNQAQLPSTVRRYRRLSRAQWWFTQMRQVVDRAMDRQPRTAARPEQMYLPVSR